MARRLERPAPPRRLNVNPCLWLLVTTKTVLKLRTFSSFSIYFAYHQWHGVYGVNHGRYLQEQEFQRVHG